MRRSKLASMTALVTLLAIALSFPLVGKRASVKAQGAEGNGAPLPTVAEIDEHIRRRLCDVGVPGLAIALIRDGQVVWTQGYGVANVFTRRPVTAESIFEVASISKPIAAYAALQLVDRGMISLDEPVASYLQEPWLPSSPQANAITLRHLLSHSAGLTNRVDVVDKRIAFEPGSRFSYSGVGYIYLQQVIESVTGDSLERVASELVFSPLSRAAAATRTGRSS